MPTVLAPSTITVEDETEDTIDMFPVQDSSIGDESRIPDSDNLIAEDELEGSDDRSDESVVENASAVVLCTLPVSPVLLILYTDSNNYRIIYT